MLEFKKITEFPRGTMYDILQDAYMFDKRNRKIWDGNWKESDDFFHRKANVTESAYTGDYLYYEIVLQ